MQRNQARNATEKMDQDMAKQKTDAREEHLEMVDALATSRSKADRLQGKLDSSKVIIEQYALEAKDHQSKMPSSGDARTEAETKLEELMEAWKEHPNPQQEDQQKQLLSAVESSKLACRRADDFHQEIKSLKARHAHVVEALERELNTVCAAQANAGDQSGSPASMLLDLQEQVRHLTEERNVLQNTLEWQEVQWRTKVEDLETKLAVQSSAAAAA